MQEQKGFRGRIIAEREKEGSGKGVQRKAYMIEWESFWMDCALLRSHRLIEDWRTSFGGQWRL